MNRRFLFPPALAGLQAFLGALPLSAQTEPKLSFNLFGDIRAVGQDTSPGGHSRGDLGQMDFMAQGQLNDTWSAFVEAVLEYDPDLKSTGVDLERFYVQYSHGDALNAGLGKRHVPLGYWNNAFHHGAVFQPTIDRPDLVKFEDGGGLQPAHDTGFWLNGRFNEHHKLAYDVMLGNGQTGNQAEDANANKAFTAHLEENLFGPVTLGLSFRSDRLAPNTDLNARPGQVKLITDLTFAGADLRVESSSFMLFSEYMRITERDLDGRAENSGWFVYAGLPLDRWTPYLLVENTRIDAATRVYADFVATHSRRTAGLKYAFDGLVNTKLELASTRFPDTARTERSIVLAVAFGF